jgi:hypothetical protein
MNLRALCLTLVVIMTGCATQEPKTKPNVLTGVDQRLGARNQAYSLLYGLLSDESDVSKLLLIKKESPDVGGLLKDISRAAGDAVKQIEAFSKADTRLHLNINGLPVAETETRDLISKTRAKELLAKSGEKFELRVLLTQAEALSYGSHLAVVAQAHESDPQRKKFLSDVSVQLQNLHQRLIDLMHRRWQMPAK